MKTFVSRALCTSALAGAALLVGSGIASAHVTVNSPGATQGGYAVLEFRVPTESDAASTTAVTVRLPGLTSARTEPIPGWTSVVERDGQELATSVTWTANPGSGVAVGQFQRFVLSAGPLPEQDEVQFPAAQTYSDGSVVNWDEPTPADGTEPEHPAPALELTAGSAGDDHSTGATGATVTTEPSSEADTSASGSSDTTARWLGGIGLVLGALGAALGIGATVRNRRS